jgi:hypothetical protein
MRIRLLSLVIVFCAMPLISPAGEKADNPFKKAKIGDYVVYKMTMSVNGMDNEVSIKHTVTAKNEKEVTMQTVNTFDFMGKTVNKADKDQKIDLTKPLDPVTYSLKIGKWEKTGEGKEKIKVGDKTYDCTWVSYKGATGWAMCNSTPRPPSTSAPTSNSLSSSTISRARVRRNLRPWSLRREPTSGAPLIRGLPKPQRPRLSTSTQAAS